jgi:hypothetical protein
MVKVNRLENPRLSSRGSMPGHRSAAGSRPGRCRARGDRAQIRDRRDAFAARGEMRLERRALGRRQLVVDVFREAIGPDVSHGLYPT